MRIRSTAATVDRPVGLVNGRRDIALLLGTGALATLVPFLLPDASLLGVFAVMFIWIGTNVSWNVVLGYAGILSFGQLAFFAVGAYASGMLSVKLGTAPWLDTLAGLAVGGIAALLVGMAVMRLRGVYVALITLAFHQLLVSLISNDYSGFTGGPNGIGPIEPYLTTSNLVLQSAFGYWIGLATALIVAVAAILLMRSPIGLAIVAARDAEHVARARGVRVTGYRLVAFVFSGAAAGFMGAVYAHYNTIVSPQLFGFGILMMLLAMVIVGGWGTIWGPVIGTVLLTFVNYFAGGWWPGYEGLVSAVIMVVVILFLRGGLVGVAEPRISFGRITVRSLKGLPSER
ncbi:branched-chain amino acid ABC transporter permease [Pseudonocardia sp. H11422]|uniref:branched-chain amino acid ABC transporter permease n=1 Tax=Pseudonocardia sp. H11422 TaxID=2835866 RepID=UPI002931D7AA|nr:branched-chain amino acid ABC transporter permease [Pseudonocardia sp. H11422]